MTGYTVHTGASKKFVSGWDKVFGTASAEKTKGKSSARAESKIAKTNRNKKNKKK